jgi:transaldolase/glucose-6-phosphate isomerase
MARACGPEVMPRTNPGARLGLFLGAAARAGRDKLTIVASPQIAALGAWLEQLVAESTGKRGKAILPVDLEPLAPPARYGRDRMFAYLRHAASPDPEQERAVRALEEAECAVVRIEIGDALDLGAEFFRWEVATAVAGAVLGIHPFDQPDVEASKVATRALTEAYERDGALPAERPFFEEEGILLYADAERARALYEATGADASLADVLGAHLQLVPGEYCALLAWLPMDAEAQAALQAMRCAVRDATRAATCVGFGPRFLHSTGQAYKGGPDTGVFLHVTRAVQDDLPVPGRRYGFGVVQAAQARGDIQVLVERGQRTLRAHLTGPIGAGLAALGRALDSAMAARARNRAQG